MLTPSGRFQPNRRLCLSMSDFHPESWNPMWSISTILTGLYSFMIESSPTLGSIETTTRQKRQFAKASLEFNMTQDAQFAKLFPEYVERYEAELRENANQPKPTAVSPQRHVVVAGEGLPVQLLVAGVMALLSIVMAVRFL